MKNTEAVEKSDLGFDRSKIESGTISRTQARSDRHRVNIPLEPVAMYEKLGDHVAECARKKFWCQKLVNTPGTSSRLRNEDWWWPEFCGAQLSPYPTEHSTRLPCLIPQSADWLGLWIQLDRERGLWVCFRRWALNPTALCIWCRNQLGNGLVCKAKFPEQINFFYVMFGWKDLDGRNLEVFEEIWERGERRNLEG